MSNRNEIECKRMAITLKDVASVAGVSTATVSRALAGSERVSPETADHIRTIANDLGYRYDNVARALRQKRSNLVGLVAPDFSFPYARELLFALNRELFASEFVLAAAASFGSVEHELIQVERLLGQRIDALLILPAAPFHSLENSAKAIDIALEEDIPVIQLFGRAACANTVSILPDYQAGIELTLRSVRQGSIRTMAYVHHDLALAAGSKLDACLDFRSRFSDDGCSVIPIAQIDSALTRLNDGKFADLIVCSDNDTLGTVIQHVEEMPAAETSPVFLCLDPVDTTFASKDSTVVSIEFSMGAMAREIVKKINAALNDRDFQRETLRIMPFINLSRT